MKHVVLLPVYIFWGTWYWIPAICNNQITPDIKSTITKALVGYDMGSRFGPQKHEIRPLFHTSEK